MYDAGDPVGTPVLYHHGTPSSGRPFDKHVRLAEELGVRLVSYDRAGYGDSTREARRSVADVAADVGAVADAFGFDHFATWGLSGGGPHALACASLLPRRVTRAAVVVGAAPADDPEFDFLAGMAEINLKEFGAAQEGREAIEQELRPYVEAVRSDPNAVLDQIASELPDFDREVLDRPLVRAVFRESLVESVRQGSDGWADDDLAFASSWGCRLEDIHIPVRLWQGELDVLVPRSHGEYLARKIPDAKFDLVPGAGHLLLDHWPEVLAWLSR